MEAIEASEKASKIISSYLELNNLSDLCDVEINGNYNNEIIILHNNRQSKFALPVRMGAIIDQLSIYKNNQHNKDVIDLTSGSLNVTHAIFVKDNAQQIPLTEKEIAIMAFLYKNKDRNITKDELLSEVWGYNENIETYTLETHIYRLRQKIERKPSQPEIIITDGDGYKIK